MGFVIRLVVQCLKNIWGSVQTPYATYRRLMYEDPLQLVFIFALVAAYFFWVSPIKLHTFHPFLLTLNTTRLFTLVMASYLIICFFFYYLGKSFGQIISIRAVMLTWGYTLVPTLLWFLATSLFYVILPPPRTQSILGTSLSILYLAFSLSLFWWKGILYYLTLRFALKLDMQRIILVSVVFLPMLFIYSVALYQAGVFKIPFV